MEIIGELGVLILYFTTWVPGIGMEQETHLPIETSRQPIKLFKCFMSWLCYICVMGLLLVMHSQDDYEVKKQQIQSS